MATEPKPAAADSPALAALKFREQSLIEKGKRLEGHDAEKLLAAGHDLADAKTRNVSQLAEIRKTMKETK